uniref:Nuclear receptor domain-containing protein n=1 Tax=Caenorhabditis tropicalis TaxID=1561998 RepID=A0A1I7TW32_9PELO
MSKTSERCEVCSKPPSTGYNYGAITCNACKMFFRRSMLKPFLPDCKSGRGNCKRKCAFCRFKQCIHAGMMLSPYTKTHNFQDNKLVLPLIIKSLVYMDDHRIRLFNNFLYEGDQLVSEMPDSLNFIRKPEDLKMSYREWGFMNIITVIDFLKKMHFFNDLHRDDVALIVNSKFVQLNIFSLAQDSFQSNNSCLVFPDGTEIPKTDVPGISEMFRRRAQCRLIDRLIQLKVTREECLLLTCVFLCHPDVTGLSETAKTEIATQQKYYTSALLHHCFLNYQNSGPSRFTDLLLLYQLIQNTYEDLSAHYQLRKFNNLEVYEKKIFTTEDNLCLN